MSWPPLAKGTTVGEIERDMAMSSEKYHALNDGKFEPPPATLAALGIGRVRELAAAKAHVIIREDPMFGRRGWVKEVLQDGDHGFLVLVVVFAVRKNPRGKWEELFRPGDSGRRYWRPDKLEVAA